MIKFDDRYCQNTGRRIKAGVLSLLLAFSVFTWDVPLVLAEEPSAQTPTPSVQTTEPEPPPTPKAVMAADAEATVPERGLSGADVVTVEGYPCVAGEVLVQFKLSASDAIVQQALDDSEEQDEITDNLHIAEVPAGETITGYIDELEEQPDVLYAQPNYIYYLDDTERIPVTGGFPPGNGGTDAYANDPGFGLQWHLNTINAPSAWDTTMGNSGVRVAVLDTGVDLKHPDLAGRILYQTDVVDYDGRADDDDGHGTHVAGIIAATANNGLGVAGVAPGVSLITVDVFDTDGTDWWATTADIVEGINYAISNDADIINMSLGSYYLDYAESNAIDEAVNNGILVLAAAGNDNTTTDHYPSDQANVVSVIATSRYDTRAYYSNYGSQKDISAPGGDGDVSSDWILSTYYDPKTGLSSYAWMAGTSMASPVVAGVAALLLSANYSLNANDVKEALYNSAVDLGAPGRDNNYGYGRVDANSAIMSIPAILSGRYSVDRRNRVVYGVPLGTSVETLASYFTGRGGTIMIRNANQQEVTSGTVKTGMFVCLKNESVILDSLFIAVRGDVNGDNSISIADYTYVRLSILGKRGLSPVSMRAGDVNNDGSLNISDYTALKLHIMGTSPIS